MERQYFEQTGMSPLTAVPYNRNSTNYTIQQQLQHPMQVPLSRPIPMSMSMAPPGLSPVSVGYSTQNHFGSYSYPAEFNAFPLNSPTPVYHPNTVSCNEHSQCGGMFPQGDDFHWSYALSGSEPNPEPVSFNNTRSFTVPPGFYPNQFNEQGDTQAVDFCPAANVADYTSSMPFGFGTAQPSRGRGMLVSPNYPMTNFHGTFPSASPVPVNVNNNTQSVPPTFHPNQFNGLQAMQAPDFLPVADVADHTRTSPMTFGFGTAQPPRMMVFQEKSPMAKLLEKFPPGDYIMEIRVIPTNPDQDNLDSPENGFEDDFLSGDEGKERMKLVIQH